MIFEKRTNKITYDLLIKLWLISLFINLCFVILFGFILKIEFKEDPWFEKVSYNLIRNGSTKISWGSNENSDLLTDSPLKSGIYYNWRPLGYSIFLLIPNLLYENFFLIRTVLQLIIYSLIPIFIWVISFLYFKNIYISHLCFFIWLFLPSFTISPLQNIDTWFITLFTVINFIFLIKIYELKKIYFLLFFINIFLLYLFRPISTISILLFLIFIFLRVIFIDFDYNKITKILKCINFIFVTIILFIAFNYFNYNVISLSQSNFGYNFWLGNNEYTLDYLINNFGDGSDIEENIIHNFDKKWSFLKNYDEYQKDIFFRKEAMLYIIKNPEKNILNIAIKFLGFFSPLRFREDTSTISIFKAVINFAYTMPFIILFFYGLYLIFTDKNFRKNEHRLLIYVFVLFWCLPYLFFFTTIRFRTPIDFLLIIISIDIIIYKFGFLLKRLKFFNNYYISNFN